MDRFHLRQAGQVWYALSFMMELPMALIQRWLQIPFWQRVAGAFILGALAGWWLGPMADIWLAPLGTLYLTLIRMIAVPLVLFAVISAVSALNGSSIAALGGRTLAWFALTAICAVLVALMVGWAFNPGNGVDIPLAAEFTAREVPLLVQVLLDIVPANPFKALAEGKILQVILFAGLVGFALVKLGDDVAQLRILINQASDAMVQLTRFVLEMTPLGTFGLIAALVGNYGFQELLPLGSFVIAVYLACIIQIIGVYAPLLALHGLNPWRFFRGAAPGMQVGFVSSSSLASMPVALRCVSGALGVDRHYAAFAVPLGATIKMDGCGAIYPVLAAMFAAQYHGMELGMGHYAAILLASVLGSFGTAGVPGTAVVMATVVLGAAGLPLDVLGMLLAIDRVLDMMRTMTNVTGQMLVPVLVARETGLIDREAYARASARVGMETDASGLKRR